jgi:hypothetical protein
MATMHAVATAPAATSAAVNTAIAAAVGAVGCVAPTAPTAKVRSAMPQRRLDPEAPAAWLETKSLGHGWAEDIVDASFVSVELVADDQQPEDPAQPDGGGTSQPDADAASQPDGGASSQPDGGATSENPR